MMNGQCEGKCGDFDGQEFVADRDAGVEQEIAKHDDAEMMEQVDRVRRVGKIAKDLRISVHELIEQHIADMTGDRIGQADGINS